MLRSTLVCCDVGQVDFGLRAGGQFNLGFFCPFFQTLHGKRIAAQVHALIFLELVSEIINQPAVEILTPEEGVTVG